MCGCNNCSILLFIIVVYWLHLWSVLTLMNYSKEVIHILKSCNSNRGVGCKMWEEIAAHRSAIRLNSEPSSVFHQDHQLFCTFYSWMCGIFFRKNCWNRGHSWTYNSKIFFFYCNLCSTLQTIIMYFLSSSSWFIFRLPVLTEVACAVVQAVLLSCK